MRWFDQLLILLRLKKLETIKSLFGVDPAPMMLSDKGYTTTDLPVSSPDLVVGLELEIESWDGDNEYRGFEFKEDNSLRGNSIEAVTRPTKVKYLHHLLTGFFDHNKITESNYSERCGTHVHMNVSDLTEDQLATFCMLYQVCERLLFTYVGDDRDKNIFCVPWEQAGISYDLLHNLRTRRVDFGRSWRKYTALNLVPITSFGSVEFRHLPGTCDVPYIMGWINLIGCMYNYAKSRSYTDTQKTVIDLNTSSAYNAFITDIFGEYTSLFTVDNLHEQLEIGVINVKLMSISDLKPKSKIKTPAEKYNLAYIDDLVNEDMLRAITNLQRTGRLDRTAATIPARPPAPPRVWGEYAAPDEPVQF